MKVCVSSFYKNVVVSLVGLFLVAGCASNKPNFDRDKALQSRVAAGAAYLQADDLARARTHALRALEIDKNSGQALTLLALIYKQEKDFVAAEEHFLKAVKQKDNRAQAYNNYGVMLYDIQRYDDAIEAFEHAASDDAYSQRASALNNVGRCYKELGDYEKALAAWTRALQINPYEPSANLAMAQYFYQKQDFDKANRYFEFFERGELQNAESALLGLRLAEKNSNTAEITRYQQLWLEASKEGK